MIKVAQEWKQGFIAGFVGSAEKEYDEKDADHAGNAYWEDELDDGQQSYILSMTETEQFNKGFTAGKKEVLKWLENDD